MNRPYSYSSSTSRRDCVRRSPRRDERQSRTTTTTTRTTTHDDGRDLRVHRAARPTLDLGRRSRGRGPAGGGDLHRGHPRRRRQRLGQGDLCPTSRNVGTRHDHAGPTAYPVDAGARTSCRPTPLTPETVTTVVAGTDGRSRADRRRTRAAHGHLSGDRQSPADRPRHRDLHRPAGRVADRRQRRAAVDQAGGAQSGRRPRAR